MTPPTIPDHQKKKDLEHLKLLSIFHFIFAGLAFLGIGFLILHYAFMRLFFGNPEFWKGQKNPPPFSPTDFMHVLVWFYALFGVLLVVVSVLNLLSGLFLRQRKHRLFSLVIAGLDYLQIPFGTALGVFTIIVLIRESVQALYSSEAPP